MVVRLRFIGLALLCAGFVALTTAQPAMAASRHGHHHAAIVHWHGHRTVGSVHRYARYSSVNAGSAYVAPSSVACNCVAYVRSVTGLPGGPSTAAGYTEAVMSGFGYQHVLPRAGAILVWDAGQKGASASAGHMAIVTRAAYDAASGTWIVSVRQANWDGCSIRNTTFNWGDLNGVNAYVRM